MASLADSESESENVLEDMINTRFGQVELTNLGQFQSFYKESKTYHTFTAHACKLEGKTSEVPLLIAITPSKDATSQAETIKLEDLNWASLHLRSCKDFTILKSLAPLDWDSLIELPKQKKSARKLPADVWIDEISDMSSSRSKRYNLRGENPLKHVIALETRATNVDVGNGLLREYEIDLVLDHSLHVTIRRL
jgi:hypothetical protein